MAVLAVEVSNCYGPSESARDCVPVAAAIYRPRDLFGWRPPAAGLNRRDARGRHGMRRESRRWRTSFGRFVGSVGVERLTVALRSAGQPVTQKAVYNWVAGDRSPRPSYAAEIVRISRGQLALGDVYRHRLVVAGRRD